MYLSVQLHISNLPAINPPLDGSPSHKKTHTNDPNGTHRQSPSGNRGSKNKTELIMATCPIAALTAIRIRPYYILG